MSEFRRGVLYASGAYLVWGLSPLYWKLLQEIPAFQLLAHRILWCALLLAAYLLLTGRREELAAVVRSRRAVLSLLASTACISVNWFLYIWSVNNDHILDASLAYYINPLVTVLLGMVVLGERLNRWQALSVALAAVGVGILATGTAQLPWISLIMAGCFALYGLLRKTVPAGPEAGLLVETVVLSPLMLGTLVWAGATGAGAFGRQGPGTDLLLVAAGVITAVPLVWFTHGARRLPLYAVGLLQYLAPTLQFALAVAVYREPFAGRQLAAFLAIWAALAVFTSDAQQRARRRRGAAKGGPVEGEAPGA